MDDARNQLQRAYALIKQGRPSAAAAILSPILEIDPQNAEAWWLMAHAALNARESVDALRRVLKINPGYLPARRMLDEQQLLHIRELADSGERRAAYLQLKDILNRQPESAEAWWLAAQIAPMRSDAIAAAHHVLTVQPTHLPAQQFIEENQKLMAASLVAKEKTARQQTARGKGCLLGVVALLVLAFGGTLFYVSASGNTFGLPIGSQFNQKFDLGIIGNSPLIRPSSLVVGATHEYAFILAPNYALLANVIFVSTDKPIGQSFKLYFQNGAKRELIKYGASTGSKTATLYAEPADGGHYILVLVGTSGAAQGAYTLQIAASAMSVEPSR